MSSKNPRQKTTTNDTGNPEPRDTNSARAEKRRQAASARLAVKSWSLRGRLVWPPQGMTSALLTRGLQQWRMGLAGMQSPKGWQTLKLRQGTAPSASRRLRREMPPADGGTHQAAVSSMGPCLLPRGRPRPQAGSSCGRRPEVLEVRSPIPRCSSAGWWGARSCVSWSRMLASSCSRSAECSQYCCRCRPLHFGQEKSKMNRQRCHCAFGFLAAWQNAAPSFHTSLLIHSRRIRLRSEAGGHSENPHQREHLQCLAAPWRALAQRLLWPEGTISPQLAPGHRDLSLKQQVSTSDDWQQLVLLNPCACMAAGQLAASTGTSPPAL